MYTDYGPVIRFDYSLPIWPHDPSEGAPDGEWRPLERSSYMLSLRFGYRGRPYTAHAPKLLSSPLLHEMSAGMWRGSFGETAGRPFRGLNPNPLDEDDRRRGEMGRKGGDDVHPGYIFGNFVVERWREALLWSWVVARIGGTGTPEGWVPPIEPSDAEEDDEEEDDGDDFWDHARRDDAADLEDFWDDDLHGRRAWSEIGGDDDTADLEITLTQRNTLDLRLVDHNLGRTGSDRLGTAYTFCKLLTFVAGPTVSLTRTIVGSEPRWISFQFHQPQQAWIAARVDTISNVVAALVVCRQILGRACCFGTSIQRFMPNITDEMLPSRLGPRPCVGCISPCCVRKERMRGLQ